MEEMIPVSALGATPAEASRTSLMDSMDSQAFLNLFVAQLKYQNPMEPSGGTEMMLQTAQFSQVEMLQQLLESQQQIMGMSQVSAAIGMVGNEVTAVTADGTPVIGVVEGYRITDTGPLLIIGDHEIPIDAAQQVREVTGTN